MIPVIESEEIQYDVTDLVDKLDEILIYNEMAAGALIEINWSLKFLLMLFIIFSAWKVVRK